MGNSTLYLFLITIVAAMGGLLFGYDWVVIGGAKIFYEPFFGIEDSVTLRGWAMSCALVGCLIGAVIAGMLSDRYGRKKMLLTAAVLFFVTAYGTGAANSFTWFILWRMMGGLGIGIASNISPVYIAEVSPASVRGKFVSINQLTIVLGILLAQIANWLIGDYFMEDAQVSVYSVEHAWRWMFWGAMIPAALFFIFAFMIPESPRWMAINNMEKRAVNVFARLGGEQFANDEMKAIATTGTKTETVSLKTLLHPSLRKILMIGIVLAVIQQWCGINVIFNYAHEIFSAAGYAVSDVLMNIVITGITNLVFTLVAIFTIDKLGRRTLFLIGFAGLTTIYAIMGLCYFFNVSGLPMLVLVILAIACYAMSLAPVVWVVLSEIFPTRIRGAAMAVSTFFLWTACFVLTYTFPLLNEWLKTSGTFWTYGLICLLGFLFVRRHLPETSGKSLEEIEKELCGQSKEIE